MPVFEDDVGKIRSVYRKMNAHVRKFASGDFAAQSQALLNELAKAMLCLTDLQRKREYDATLGRRDSGGGGGGEGRRRTFEEILLAGKVVDRDQLARARNFATAVGLDLRDALLQQKLGTPETVMLAYAESLGLPYVDLVETGLDPALVTKVPAQLCRARSCVPVMSDGAQLLMASPHPLNPEVEEELRLRLGMPVRSVLCTAAQVNEALAKHFPRTANQPAAAKSSSDSDDEDSDESPAATRDEQSRKQGMYAVMGFAMTVALSMVAQNLIFAENFHFISGTLISFALGSIVGGVTFFLAKK
jgi:hypothetical protein